MFMITQLHARTSGRAQSHAAGRKSRGGARALHRSEAGPTFALLQEAPTELDFAGGLADCITAMEQLERAALCGEDSDPSLREQAVIIAARSLRSAASAWRDLRQVTTLQAMRER